jgi:hypothetical protein
LNHVNRPGFGEVLYRRMKDAEAVSNKESVKPPLSLRCGTVTETFPRENVPARL